MKTKNILVLAALLLLGIVCYKIVFVPTSLTMRSNPQKVFASSSSPVIVKATLINRLGFAVPFERLVGKFVIYQGADKIDVVRNGTDELVFKTRGESGRLIIYFYSTTIPFPVEMVLDIRESAIADLVFPK